MKLLKLSYIILFMLLLSSCSYREVILRQAPDLLSEQVNDYLSLTSTQETQLKIKVTNAFFSHSKEVKEIRKILKNYNVKEDSLKLFVKKGYSPYRIILKSVNAITIEVLQNLDYKQRLSLVLKRKEIKAELQKNYALVGVKRLEKVFGKLSPDQINLVNTYAKKYQGSKSNNEKWHSDFTKTLEIKDQKKYSSSLKANFSGVESLESILSSSNDFFQFFEKFSKTLSLDQVASFNSKKKEAINWIDLYLKIYNTPLKSL